MNPLKRLASETALYGVSSVVGRLLNYLLFPLHTLVFPTRDYGIITELYVYAAFLNIIYLYGLETAYFRFSAEHDDDETSIFNTGITAVLLSSIVFTLILVAFATPIVNWMDYQGQEHFVYIFAGILAFDSFFALPYARLRRMGKAKKFALTKIFGIGINIAINLFFLLFCYQVYQGNFMPSFSESILSIYNPSYHLEYVFLANLAASAGVGLFLFSELRNTRFKISSSYLRKMWAFGYPLLFTGLALVTNEMLSRAALKYWLPEGFYPDYTNQEILGIFGGVFKLAILMNLGIQAFRYAAEPFFFTQGQSKESPKLFSQLLTWFVIFGCILWAGVSFNLDILQYLLRNPDYRFAMNVVPLLLLGSLFMGINYNLSAWYKLIDFTHAGTLITVIGALITIVANFLLIPLYGYFGSAYAAILAYASMTIISYLWSRKKNPIPYQTGRLLLYLLSFSIIIYLGMNLELGSMVKNIMARNGIIIVLIFVIYRIEIKKSKSSTGTRNE